MMGKEDLDQIYLRSRQERVDVIGDEGVVNAPGLGPPPSE